MHPLVYRCYLYLSGYVCALIFALACIVTGLVLTNIISSLFTVSEQKQKGFERGLVVSCCCFVVWEKPISCFQLVDSEAAGHSDVENNLKESS